MRRWLPIFWCGLLFLSTGTQLGNNQDAFAHSELSGSVVSSQNAIGVSTTSGGQGPSACAMETGPEGPSVTTDVPGRPHIKFGTRRPGRTYLMFETASVQDCCKKCEQDKNCQSWTRQRSSGLCGFKASVPPLMDGAGEYDSGRSAHGNATQYAMDPVAEGDAVVTRAVGGRVVAAEEVPIDFNCTTEEGRKRLESSFLALEGKSTVDSPEDCCTECDETVNCFTWSFEKTTGVCTLYNRFIPTTKDPDFTSGDVF